MSIYVIEGKNTQGESGTWEIEAKNTTELNKILKSRKIKAVTIDGKKVKRGKALSILKGDCKNGV